MGLVFSDYKQISFVIAWSAWYVVGTVSGTEFVSVSTMFYASRDCKIQVNNDTHETLIKAGAYLEFDRKIWRIRVKRDSANGTIDMWFEGNIAR